MQVTLYILVHHFSTENLWKKTVVRASLQRFMLPNCTKILHRRIQTGMNITQSTYFGEMVIIIAGIYCVVLSRPENVLEEEDKTFI